jgi:3-oxoadipate enol-lactonase
MIAQEVALRHPDRVGALILQSTTGGAPRADFVPAAGAAALVRGLVRPERDPELRLDRVLRLITSDRWVDSLTPGDPMLEPLREAMREPATPRGFAFQLGAAVRHSTWSRLPRIAVPTLVQHGTADKLISARAGRALARAIPSAQLELLEDTGHAIGLERPETAVHAADFAASHNDLLGSRLATAPT